MDGGAGWAAVHGVAKSQTRLSNFIFTFHFHALEKEMATHSCVLAWRIPGTGEPGGLPSMGSHRVRHDWSDLAAEIRSIVFLCINGEKAKGIKISWGKLSISRSHLFWGKALRQLFELWAELAGFSLEISCLLESKNWYTLFQQHKRIIYTWTSPDGQHQNQIDYILCSQRWRSSIQWAKKKKAWELTVAQIMNPLLPNSDLNWRKYGKPLDH